MAVEPFGQPHQDVMLATIPTTIANVNRDPKRRNKPFEVEEFLPRRRPGQTVAVADPDLEAKIDRAFALLGGA